VPSPNAAMRPIRIARTSGFPAAPSSFEEIKQLILRLKQNGLSILLVEQNVELAVGVSDLVYVMDKGRIVSSVTPTELMANHSIMETYIGFAAK
jgi:branched-chain amino acid transport system ATP-binding protein